MDLLVSKLAVCGALRGGTEPNTKTKKSHMARLVLVPYHSLDFPGQHSPAIVSLRVLTVILSYHVDECYACNVMSCECVMEVKPAYGFHEGYKWSIWFVYCQKSWDTCL